MVAIALYAVIALNSIAALIDRAASKSGRRVDRAYRLLAVSVTVSAVATVLLLVTVTLDVAGVWS